MKESYRGAHGVVVIVGENRPGNSSSNPERGCLQFHIALITWEKVWIQVFSL